MKNICKNCGDQYTGDRGPKDFCPRCASTELGYSMIGRRVRSKPVYVAGRSTKSKPVKRQESAMALAMRRAFA